MKPRHHLYLDDALSAELDRLAAGPGGSKSGIVADALRAYLARRGANELDERFRLRLDRMSNQLGRIERNQQVLLESLALFVRYYLNLSATLSEPDAAARAIGRDRFQAFVGQVGRAIASGQSTFGQRDGESR